MSDLPNGWDRMSLPALWERLNDPRRRPTPQVVVEAIMHCVRVRGVQALQEPENIARLKECDADAREQINKRIAKLLKKEPANVTR